MDKKNNLKITHKAHIFKSTCAITLAFSIEIPLSIEENSFASIREVKTNKLVFMCKLIYVFFYKLLRSSSSSSCVKGVNYPHIFSLRALIRILLILLCFTTKSISLCDDLAIKWLRRKYSWDGRKLPQCEDKAQMTLCVWDRERERE